MHCRAIDAAFDELCSIAIAAAAECFPKMRPPKRRRPRWKELVEPEKRDALFWDRLWKECGKPMTGTVRDIRQATKRRYHYAARRYLKEEWNLRNERMAECLTREDQRDLWNEVKKVSKSHQKPSPVVNGQSTSEGILKLFKDKYEELFTSVPSDRRVIDEIKTEIDRRCGAGREGAERIMLHEMIDAVKKLKPNKHDGEQLLWSNCIIFASDSYLEKMAELLQLMLIHAYAPKKMNVSTLISIPKNPTGDLSDLNNYRGIALSNIMNKVLEIIIIRRCGASLRSSELQFAYKAGHGTTMCTMLMKETINHFLNRGSLVYCCMIDATKAFDRVRYDTLFEILLKRDVPAVLIKFILYCYEHQYVKVKWDDCVSNEFLMHNGVKQG